jgi:hypothetical protein
LASGRFADKIKMTDIQKTRKTEGKQMYSYKHGEKVGMSSEDMKENTKQPTSKQMYKSAYHREEAKVLARGNKWQIENFYAIQGRR